MREKEIESMREHERARESTREREWVVVVKKVNEQRTARTNAVNDRNKAFF